MNFEQSFKNEVAACPGGERALACFLCGTCTAGCPISEIEPGYSPRKIMRKILLGNKGEVLSSGDIWRCYQCHACVAHCPQDVRFADIVRALRKMAQDEGIVDESFAAAVAKADWEARAQRLEKINKLVEGRSK
ncbi:MAG: 4Fe-4S dicluster domain-containing protein [Clostridiales bacterium]|nr:4Fe-4S dicluster domain-containing protein [Clostridiales bacterium]